MLRENDPIRARKVLNQFIKRKQIVLAKDKFQQDVEEMIREQQIKDRTAAVKFFDKLKPSKNHKS